MIHILHNYSQALKERITGMKDLALAQLVGFSGAGVSQDTVKNSTIHVYLDMTNQQVGFTVQIKLAETFQAYGSSVLTDCNIPENITSLPIQFETPVYGSNDPTFTEFMAPGVILSITYFMAVGLTSISFIIERKEGLLDRSWIAGVTSLEVMLAHVVAQFVVMVVQVSFVLIFMLLVFQVRECFIVFPSANVVFIPGAGPRCHGLGGQSHHPPGHLWNGLRAPGVRPL